MRISFLRIYAEFAQRLGHHVDVTPKGEVHIFVFRDVREHHIAHIGINTTPSALSTHGVDVVLPAVVQVHFVLDELVSPKDNGRFYLPHKEAIV